MREEALQVMNELLDLPQSYETQQHGASVIKRLVYHLDMFNIELEKAKKSIKIYQDLAIANSIEANTTPQTNQYNSFCGEQECKDNQADCRRLHKVKLSDEEILGVADKRRARINKDIGNDLLLISFARAIEAKVRGEK